MALLESNNILLLSCLFMVFCTVTQSSSASLAWRSARLEQLNRIPEGWTFLGKPDPEKRLTLRIALTQQNVAQFEQKLVDVSTPGHPAYGQHLSKAEVKAILRPTDKAIQSVLHWLRKEGIREIFHDNDWIHFNVTVKKAEKMLDTDFNVYRNDNEDVNRIRTLGYSVPSHLRGFINMIQPTTRFGQLLPQRSPIRDKHLLRKADGLNKSTNKATGFDFSQCNVTDDFNAPDLPTVTIDCLRNLYKLGSASSKKANSGSKFGIAGYLDEFAKFADLELFLNEYAPYANGTKFSVTLINGGKNDQAINASVDSGEANLDVQMAVPLAYTVPVIYYSTGGRGPAVFDIAQPTGDTNEPYLEFLTYILGLPDSQLPQTLTTSYGENEQSIPAPYVLSICNMLAQLGARGVSILFSSGDYGPGQGCLANDGSNAVRFLPVFPAGCPFVTAVGGTVGVVPEKAAALSGGGFSDLFPRPSYQNDAVNSYLQKLGTQWQGLFNSSGRAYPDVAAQSMHLQFVDSGLDGWISGTSAASPIFSSVIALLNNARLDNGLPPLGFLNPWIYSTGKAGLVDIVNGGSRGCQASKDGTWKVIPFASWNATVGWDPATGWGTPDYEKLSTLIGLPNAPYR